MKKNYIYPRLAITALQAESLLTTASAEGVGFGGTDQGTNEPSSRHIDWDSDTRSYDVWEEED